MSGRGLGQLSIATALVLLVPACALMGVAITSGPRAWRLGASVLLAATLLSHTLGMLRVNDRLRDATGPLVRWMSTRPADHLPPMFVDRMFLALPLMAHLPESHVTMPESEIQTDAQRAILAQCARPADPSARPLWLVVSGWGDPPLGQGRVDLEAILERARALASQLALPPLEMRVLTFEMAGGGKWAAVVEGR